MRSSPLEVCRERLGSPGEFSSEAQCCLLDHSPPQDMQHLHMLSARRSLLMGWERRGASSFVLKPGSTLSSLVTLAAARSRQPQQAWNNEEGVHTLWPLATRGSPLPPNVAAATAAIFGAVSTAALWGSQDDASWNDNGKIKCLHCSRPCYTGVHVSWPCRLLSPRVLT